MKELVEERPCVCETVPFGTGTHTQAMVLEHNLFNG